MNEKNYRIHGLRVRSEIPLPAAALTPSAAAELLVEYGPRREIPWRPEVGELLAKHEANGSGFALSETASGYTIRFYGLCDFDLNRDLSRLTAYLAPTTDASIASILLASNVLSCLLSIQGECVLHASALQLGTSAIAFIGPSSSGKSTLAAALCALGLPLITDDALRCSVGSPVRCFNGANELRLRLGAEPLTELFGTESRRSIDERLVVEPERAVDTHFDLSLLIQPEFRQTDQIELRRLKGSEAMLTAIAAGRITWWRSAAIRRAQFAMLTDLCKHLPVYVLSIPEGLVFTGHGRQSILEVVQSAAQAS